MVSPSIQTLFYLAPRHRQSTPFCKKDSIPFKIQIRTLLDQLRSLIKSPDQSIVDFLVHAKSTFHSLSSAVSQLLDCDIVDCIVDGLGHDY